jgi:hypothetical protein
MLTIRTKTAVPCDVPRTTNIPRQRLIRQLEHVVQNKDVAQKHIFDRLRQSEETEGERLWNEWLAQYFDDGQDA